MCRKTQCAVCNKTTWIGCGRHISSVLEAIPSDQWCTCGPRIEQEGTQYPPM
ncbi:hypothetical protein P154DRAFT_401920, partial [Amniculicola lignicola CBS 123094]